MVFLDVNKQDALITNMDSKVVYGFYIKVMDTSSFKI